ncbi:DASS family sodium-coupled anion symporter [Luteolibacter sp. GHJ8]|uniref:DASS family sodium-coupled anion symporter n=1 Tax=Luteolibacter rhizosphaerae TaxID=2989719 RepID=A0ABT3G787_9BACT|nr:DASS family sodium-coupled anion symporter [Luteolibacter rhizosphaerae]MCW1915095.1 DASS family sodium-coupled anion symporter [Luteolibacter rhizosphaerae]
MEETREPSPDERPFFRRRETWLILLSFALIPLPFIIPFDPGAGLDPGKIRLGLGIFLCIGLLWISEALPLAATALLVPILATICGLMDMKSALAGFADPLIFLFFGGFALASAMSAQGLDQWIANQLLLRGKGSFMRVSWLVFGTTTFLSMWMSNTATTALMIPLVIGILRKLPEGEGSDRNAIYLLLGTAYASSIGGLGTVVGTPPNGIAAKQLGIGFLEWLRFGLPSMFLLFFLMVLALRLACRPTVASFPLPKIDHFKWSATKAATIAIFTITGVLWICGEWLGKMLGITAATDSLIALLAVMALVIFRTVTWRQIERGTEWGVLLLFGGGIALSTVLDKTGASLFMAREIVAMVHDWPLALLIAASLLFVILLGEFSSNTATAALMVPIFHSIGLELGIAPAKLVIPIAIASSCGSMLPVATPPNAIVFATGRIPQRQMIKTGMLLDFLCLLGVTLLAWWIF